jgi:hypothetical protein
MTEKQKRHPAFAVALERKRAARVHIVASYAANGQMTAARVVARVTMFTGRPSGLAPRSPTFVWARNVSFEQSKVGLIPQGLAPPPPRVSRGTTFHRNEIFLGDH